MFGDAINIVGKIDRYPTGFFNNFGYFRRHASPSIENYCVTYIQAYSSAAKMARPSGSGFVAAYVICWGYAEESKCEEIGRSLQAICMRYDLVLPEYKRGILLGSRRY
ncbi:hypothetical protein RF55_12841 [Lasius niger]|uniref:Uncharacterized protein n=1 Tax=Lasius niger TaxID=67767 RepID=A0A0J7KC19_LASNI|nr:hypothetical protein RF55_12841 [Lasius niger]